MARNRAGANTGNAEWGRKARKEEDALRGRNNRARRDAIENQLTDDEEGCTVTP